jgi:hypothetical protein
MSEVFKSQFKDNVIASYHSLFELAKIYKPIHILGVWKNGTISTPKIVLKVLWRKIEQQNMEFKIQKIK